MQKKKPHNKNKTLVNYIGFSSYEHKEYQKTSLYGFLRINLVFITLMGLGKLFNVYSTPHELINPLVSINEVEQVQAVEATPEPLPTIEEYIKQTYPENPEGMVKLFTCESGLNPETIGDKHLMGMLDGEMIGDSVGIAQIRTGDAGVYDSRPWNRAKANGMSVEEFRTKLKDPYYNIDYSRDIYDRQGIYAWANCARKVGLIK